MPSESPPGRNEVNLGKMQIKNPEVLIINPLSSALRHYEDELKNTVEQLNFPVRVLRNTEPSQSGKSKITWVVRHIHQLLQAKASRNSIVLVTWPVLGFIDALACSILIPRRGFVVFHDPTPLVRAVGYSSIFVWFMKLMRVSNVIAHSGMAQAELIAKMPTCIFTLIPHPILPSTMHKREAGTKPKVIRVLGQYKSTRDLSCLEKIQNSFAGNSNRLEIYGRGWPSVKGWFINEGFIEEQQFSQLISSSDVVVIPYSHFYQSGVAIRCLETTVPFVGPLHPTLVDILGQDSGRLVTDGNWEYAITSAFDCQSTELFNQYLNYKNKCLESFDKFLSETAKSYL